MTRLTWYLQRDASLKRMLQDNQRMSTIWAPTDCAFSRLDRHVDNLLDLLKYRISAHSMSSEGILNMPNIPTLLRPPSLNGPLPLRLRPVEETFRSMVRP